MASKIRNRTAAIMLVLALAAMPVSAAAQELVPGGKAIGIRMTTQGVVVAGVSEVESGGVKKSPAAEAGIAPGDVIVRLGPAQISSAADFIAAVAKLDGTPVAVQVTRQGKTKQFTVTPAKDADGKLRLGLWLRDGVTGVGTVTFYDPASGVYGALGHGITDTDTGVLLPLGEGSVSGAAVTGVTKGESGKPGQLDGSSDISSSCGSILMNTEYGIFGIMQSGSVEGDPIECGTIKTGPAAILTTISGDTAKEYSIEVNRVYHDTDGDRVMITVTDKSLLAATGGIVQGMSGSPIIQGGNLVGAVTHVFVNDPTHGYGLSIQDMIATAKACLDKAA